MHLSPAPQYSRKKVGICSIRMQSYLCFLDSSIELYDEANENLTLYFIQQALENILLHKVATTTTLMEVWSILETKYSERGRKFEGASICEVELPMKESESTSMCEAEHEEVLEIKNLEEDGKSHYAQPYVEDDTFENSTIHIVDDIDLMKPTIVFL